MKSKGRIIFIVVACVVPVLVAIIGFMVFREIRALRKDGQMLDVRKENLRMAQGADPFPNIPNVIATSNNWVKLEKELARLSQRMGKGQIVPDRRRTRVQWITLLDQTQKNLKKLAQTNEVSLPDEFSFGFDLYEEGTPPASTAVPRLTQQLLMVEELCRTLYGAGISEVKSIEREEFDGAATGRTVARRRRTQRGATNIMAEVYSKENFTIEFSAPSAAFIECLNSLASHELFIVVNDVQLTGSDGIAMESEEPEGRRKPKKEADDEEVGAKPIDDRKIGERIVSGTENEVPATVKLELDIYTFLLAKRGSR